MNTCAHTRHQRGCRSCQSYSRAYDERRRTRIASGTWTPLTPAATIRSHITALRAAGMSLTRIARTAGLSPRTVYGVVNGTRSHVHGPTAAAILAVTPSPALPANMVPAIGTTRRLRALVAAGWSLSHQATHLNIPMQQVSGWAAGRRATVTTATHRRVAEMFTLLEHQPGPSHRARNLAARRGWPPPEAWPDSCIDDPAARALTGDGIDEVAIAAALNPHRRRLATHLHPHDQAELYRRLHVDEQLTEGQIRSRLDLSQHQVAKLARAWLTHQPQLATAS